MSWKVLLRNRKLVESSSLRPGMSLKLLFKTGNELNALLETKKVKSCSLRPEMS